MTTTPRVHFTNTQPIMECHIIGELRRKMTLLRKLIRHPAAFISSLTAAAAEAHGYCSFSRQNTSA